ncbi:hypothetical protein A3731_11845 [Roseovarius sp. HI0049]|nr:hypothetical protein A3731_11845 [Roseovarius sp. HI0049]
MAEGDENVVLVTGGASGLGSALVRAFRQRGSSVVVLDRSRQALDRLQDDLGTDDVAYVCGDVTDLSANEDAVSVAMDRFARLDTFIGNAAIWDFSVSLMELPPDKITEAFDEVFHVNVLGYILGSRAAAPALAKSRGSIVFTLSNAALYSAGGGPLYTAAKHAGVGLTRQLAFELSPKVRVNAVAPSGMATALSGPPSLGFDSRDFKADWNAERFASRVPLGFVPTAEDYVGAYLYLADRSARATTGVVLPVELGWGIRGLHKACGDPDL